MQALKSLSITQLVKYFTLTSELINFREITLIEYIPITLEESMRCLLVNLVGVNYSLTLRID